MMGLRGRGAAIAVTFITFAAARVDWRRAATDAATAAA